MYYKSKQMISILEAITKMVKKHKLETFMKEHKKYCSFTDWSKGANVTYSDVENRFSNNFVFVALNPTSLTPLFIVVLHKTKT